MDRAGQQVPGPEESIVARIAAEAQRCNDRNSLFAVAAEEAGRLVGAGAAMLVGFADGGPAKMLASWGGADGEAASDATLPPDGLTKAIMTAGEPRGQGLLVGAPVASSDGPWAVLYVVAPRAAPTAVVMSQLQTIARLFAMAVAARDGQAALEDAADRQAAVRRIGELAARGVAQQELFEALAREASRVAGDAPTALVQFEDDVSVVVVSAVAGAAPPGTRKDVSADDPGVIARIRRTGRTAHGDEDRAGTGPLVPAARGVAVPILGGDRVWGGLLVAAGGGLPIAGRRRLEDLAALVAPIFAGAHAKAELERVAQDQAALGRVAEVVASGAAPDAMFAAVAAEASALLSGDATTLLRYEDGGGVTVVATCGGPAPPGTRFSIGPDDDSTPARVLRTGRPARTDRYPPATKPDYARRFGIWSSVGAPIVVDHRVWGMLGVTTADHPLPAASERRLLQFAELVAVAIAHAQGRAELTASRARVVAAADESRRRVQRDIHEGVQQRLVQAITTLKLAMEEMNGQSSRGRERVREALTQAELAAADMRTLVRGILPASLTRGGLLAGLETLVDNLPLAVELDVTTARLAAPIETTAYFVVAEALSNVAKHAGSSRATVRAVVERGALLVEVRDDGAGGAEIGRGTGLTALLDRVVTGEGTLTVDSPPGSGTRVVARLPLTAEPGY